MDEQPEELTPPDSLPESDSADDDEMHYAPPTDAEADEINAFEPEGEGAEAEIFDAPDAELEAEEDFAEEAEAFDDDDQQVQVFEDAEALEAPPSGDEAEYADDSALADATERARDEMAMNFEDVVDVDAALAAVTTLDDYMTRREKQKIAGRKARIAAKRADEQAIAQAELLIEEADFAMPPIFTLGRGDVASVIPGILLILIGAWLTYTFTATDTELDNGLVAGVIAGAFGITLLVQWLSAERWSPGSLFIALTLLIATGITVYLQQPDTIEVAEGWPVYVVALGSAALLTGFLARPVNRRFLLPGLLLGVAGIVGLLVTTETLTEGTVDDIEPFWPVVLAIVVVLWLLPLLARRRG